MTPQQKRLYDIIYDHMSEHGFCPSYEEMREAMGLKSRSGIHRLILSLEARGHIRRTPNRARAIELLAVRDPIIPEVRTALQEQATEWVVKAAKGIRPTQKKPNVTIPENAYRELVSALRKLRAV